MFENKFEKLTPKERGKILQDRRKAKGLSQSDLAVEISSLINNGTCYYQPELVELANEVIGDTKKISEWETGRIKKIPDNYLEVWKLVLGMNQDKIFEKLVLPVITREDFDSPYVQLAVEFLEYVLTKQKENGLEEYEVYASRHGMRDLIEDFFATYKVK